MSIGSWIMSILKVALLVLWAFHSGYQNLRKEMYLILVTPQRMQSLRCWQQSEGSLQDILQLLWKRFILKARKFLCSIRSSKGTVAIGNTNMKNWYIIIGSLFKPHLESTSQ